MWGPNPKKIHPYCFALAQYRVPYGFSILLVCAIFGSCGGASTLYPHNDSFVWKEDPRQFFGINLWHTPGVHREKCVCVLCPSIWDKNDTLQAMHIKQKKHVLPARRFLSRDVPAPRLGGCKCRNLGVSVNVHGSSKRTADLALVRGQLESHPGLYTPHVPPKLTVCPTLDRYGLEETMNMFCNLLKMSRTKKQKPKNDFLSLQPPF